MKKYKISVISLFFILAVPTAFAQTQGESIRKKAAEFHGEIQNVGSKIKNAASSTRTELDQGAVNLREQIEEKKTAVENTIQQHRKKIIKALADRTTKRLDAAADRLDSLEKRIESRLSKMEALKMDTTEAKKHLETAKQQIARIKTQIISIENSSDEIVSSNINATTTEEVRKSEDQNIQEMKDRAKEITEALKTAQVSLTQALTDIKAASPAAAPKKTID